MNKGANEMNEWTTEKPTTPGYYFAASGGVVVPVRITQMDGGWWATEFGFKMLRSADEFSHWIKMAIPEPPK